MSEHEFLWGITLGSFPYNIGPWTIFVLGSILVFDKLFSKNKTQLVQPVWKSPKNWLGHTKKSP